jgi:hypothetical protein
MHKWKDHCRKLLLEVHEAAPSHATIEISDEPSAWDPIIDDVAFQLTSILSKSELEELVKDEACFYALGTIIAKNMFGAPKPTSEASSWDGHRLLGPGEAAPESVILATSVGCRLQLAAQPGGLLAVRAWTPASEEHSEAREARSRRASEELKALQDSATQFAASNTTQGVREARPPSERAVQESPNGHVQERNPADPPTGDVSEQVGSICATS